MSNAKSVGTDIRMKQQKTSTTALCRIWLGYDDCNKSVFKAIRQRIESTV